MRLRSAFNFGKGVVTLGSDEARHLREVLRLKTGDEVQVFDGAGKEFRAVVSQARREFAELEIGDEIQSPRPESPLQLTLAVALLKGEKFDLVVQKGTELGVNRFVPLITRYADIVCATNQTRPNVSPAGSASRSKQRSSAGESIVPGDQRASPFRVST